MRLKGHYRGSRGSWRPSMGCARIRAVRPHPCEFDRAFQSVKVLYNNAFVLLNISFLLWKKDKRV